MANDIKLKVYNKEDKLNLLIRDSSTFKVVVIYKYNGENIDTHSYIVPYTCELHSWQAYYELRVEEGGKFKESLVISEAQMEHNEWFGELEVVRTTVNLESKNRYENRIKYFEGEKYEVEFKNDKLYDFKFNLHENKINEYLKTLHDGREKN